MLYLLGDRRVKLHGHHHYVAPSATVVGRVVLEDEASIWFHVVVRGDNDLIVIGARSNIQDASVLHTDEGVPMTDRDCLIGACSLVPEGKVIPDRSLVMGVPGKVVRQLRDDEIAAMRNNADHYVENARRYLRDLRPDPRG